MAGNHSKDYHKHNDRVKDLERKADKAQDRGNDREAQELRETAKTLRKNNPY